ncbi:MAG: hypothetical protein ABIS50_21130 [Luteolibacter sp.]|uniref:hypothetical protein n=1 Tax=Luteolibacter sp. TaxID=1962973 RepID=UPI003264BC36
MKTILFAAFAAAVTIAPLHAAKIKSQAFIVKSVVISSRSGKIPPGVPVFHPKDTVTLNISRKILTGPQKIALPIVSKSASSDVYHKGTRGRSYSEATVHKNTTTKKPIGVDLTFLRPVRVSPDVPSPGQVVYSLVPKK